MATISPAMLQITQKITKLRTEVPIPNSWLNPKYLLTFVITVVVLVTIYFHSSDSNLDLQVTHDLSLNRVDDLKEVTKVNISSLVIYTRYRSGSSLIGELFNRNPDVFYIFEPFKIFPTGLDLNSFIKAQAAGYLSDLGRCNFQGIVNDSISLLNAQGDSVKSLRLGTFCRKARITQDPKDYSKCRKMPLASIEQICRKHSWVVTKTIRIYDINALVPYLQQDHKVIHLLRDPRGMISSQIKIEQIKRNKSDEVYFRDLGLRVQEVRIKAQRACQDIRENIQTVRYLVNEVPEFQMLYYIIRYEDFAENPVEQAKSLYRFAGLNFHQSVHEWLLSATSGVDPTQQKPGTLKYSYSTNRYSSVKTANGWRFHLPFQIVRAIQKICYKELIILGYIPANNIIELTDIDFKLHKNFSLPYGFS